MRDAITPCTVSGSELASARTSSHRPSRRARVPSSTIIRSSSPAKNGLPSERCRIAPTTSAGACPPSRCAISAAPSPADSGESDSDVAFESPPPQSARRSNRSGRAMQSTSAGPVARAITVSISSSRLGSAQWMSSMSARSGPSAAIDSR